MERTVTARVSGREKRRTSSQNVHSDRHCRPNGSESGGDGDSEDVDEGDSGDEGMMDC